jgi:hypothetical protein
LYSQRWGIEVFFRTVKQAYERSKLLAGTPANAKHDPCFVGGTNWRRGADGVGSWGWLRLLMELGLSGIGGFAM